MCAFLHKNVTLENFLSRLSNHGIKIENEHTKKHDVRVELLFCLLNQFLFKGWFVEKKKELSSNNKYLINAWKIQKTSQLQ